MSSIAPEKTARNASSAIDRSIPVWKVVERMLHISRPISDDFSAATAVEAGIPASAVTALEKLIGIANRRLIIPDRTLTRREKEHQSLTTEEGDRVLQSARIVALAMAVFGSEDKAAKWLFSPKKRFDGKTPMELAVRSSPGVTAVEQWLGQLDEGFFA